MQNTNLDNTITSKCKLAFIGAGAMGSAIAKGLVHNKTFMANEIIFCDLDEKRVDTIANELQVQTTNCYDRLKTNLDDNALIILAVKPQVFEQVLASLQGIKDSNILISIAAGKTIESIEKVFATNEIFRVMPNTPAQVLKAASAISANTKASKTNLEKVKEIFNTIGVCVAVNEKDLDAVTALSGSGPAYVFLMTEAMTQAGIELGLDAQIAETLARQTLYGAASLMIESQESAKALRDKVTSPNGTTQAGIENLEANDFRTVILEALQAAKARSLELN